MNRKLSDEALRARSIELAQKILAQVDQDYKKALFVASGNLAIMSHETEILIDEITFWLTLNQPVKRGRGRPPKINAARNLGLMPRKNPKKRIGAPKKYLPNIPNRALAIKVAWISNAQSISCTRAAKILLEQSGLQDEKVFVKTLAEEAKKIVENRRQFEINSRLNSMF